MTERAPDFWINLVKVQVRLRVLVSLIIMLVTGVFLYGIVTKLEIKTDFFDLYPPSHQYIKLYKEFRQMFGSANILSIIIERTDDKDIYNPETLKKVNELTQGILATKGCNPLQVSSIAHPKVKNIQISSWGIGVTPLMSPRVPINKEESDRFRKIVYSNEGVRGFYVSLNDKAAVVYAGFWEEGVDLRFLWDQVMLLKSKIEDKNHKIMISGYPMLYAWIAYYMPEILKILGATVLAMLVLLVIYFRTYRGILIPFFSMIVSVVWGLGFAAYMGFSIDPLLLVVPLLLSARALSHSCQCLDRFHQEYLKIQNTNQAIAVAYGTLYPPALLAIVTDGLGILAVAISTIPLMQKLAFFSSFWIISLFVAVVILNPIILSFLPAPNVKEHDIMEIENIDRQTMKGPYSKFVDILWKMSNPGARIWVLVSLFVIIIGGGALSLKYLTVGDMSAGAAILYPEHPYNIAEAKMNKEFVGASTLIVIAKGKETGAIKYKHSLATLEKLGIFMQKNIETVGGTLSITDLVQSIFRMYHEGSPKWIMVPTKERDLGALFFTLSSNMAPGEMDRFVDIPNYTHSNVTAFLRNYNNKTIKNAIDKVKEFGDQVAKDPEAKIEIKLAAGILGILAAVNEEVEWSYWAIMIAIFSSTFLLCCITFRSINVAIVLIIPLAVSQVLCELFMVLMHIDFNISSLPVASIGVGVGVDYGIYLMDRLREESLTHDFEEARYRTLATTGKVIMFTALTLFVGIVFWLFATMKFQSEMGLLIGVLMICNCFMALIGVPALTGIIKPHFVQDWKSAEKA